MAATPAVLPGVLGTSRYAAPHRREEHSDKDPRTRPLTKEGSRSVAPVGRGPRPPLPVMLIPHDRADLRLGGSVGGNGQWVVFSVVLAAG
jgi:hypothetical protein